VRQQFSVAGNVRHHRNAGAIDILEYYDWTLAKAIKLEDHRGHFEITTHRLPNSKNFFGKGLFRGFKKSTQTLVIDRQ
jgi:hypothetical protein